MAERRIHLDFARGVAALAVCAGHLRAFQFVALRQVEAPSLVDRAFYLATGFGHQAVMVFFVLSGYFIAGAVADSVAKDRWSWRGYALRRLTRLWLVLIPALVLTLIWDRLGMHLAGGRGYDGRFAEILFSGPTTDQPVAHTWLSFLGNMAFLQTIACPVLGSNGPLWSLANEFWYYVLFPLGYLSLHPRTSGLAQFLSILACAVIAVCLPLSILAGMAVWLLGFGVHVAMRSPACLRLLANALAFVTFSLLFIASLVFVRLSDIAIADLVASVAFAGMMPFLIVRQPASGLYRRVASGLSEISYTLYVVHFPFLAFVFFSFRLPEKSFPAAGSYLAFGGLLALTLAYAAVVWWFFEKRTEAVRKWIETAAVAIFMQRRARSRSHQ